jgi:hypothetical protein
MSKVTVISGGEQVPAGKFLQLEREARDPSRVSMLASLEISRENPATSGVQEGVEGYFPVNNQSNKAADSGVVISHNQDSKMEVFTLCFPWTLAASTILTTILTKLVSDIR